MSLKQKAANRCNALHSTASRTEESQLRVSVNALKHGLTAPIEATPRASACSVSPGALLAGDVSRLRTVASLPNESLNMNGMSSISGSVFGGILAPTVVISTLLQEDLQQVDVLEVCCSSRRCGD